jgi:hypothetical protein
MTAKTIIDNINDVLRYAADNEIGYSNILSKFRNPGATDKDPGEMVKTTVDLLRDETDGE